MTKENEQWINSMVKLLSEYKAYLKENPIGSDGFLFFTKWKKKFRTGS